MSRCVWFLMVAGLITAIGCEGKSPDQPSGKVTSDDVRGDTKQAVDTAAEFSQQSRDEFQKKIEAQLTELDAEITKLREKGRDLKDQAKVDWDRKLADLETKREAARVKLAEVGHSSAEAWKDVKQGAQSAWDDLEKAFQDASREF
jgi:hypothetical protein